MCGRVRLSSDYSEIKIRLYCREQRAAVIGDWLQCEVRFLI